jgi:hypothetical protein
MPRSSLAPWLVLLPAAFGCGRPPVVETLGRPLTDAQAAAPPTEASTLTPATSTAPTSTCAVGWVQNPELGSPSIDGVAAGADGEVAGVFSSAAHSHGKRYFELIVDDGGVDLGTSWTDINGTRQVFDAEVGVYADTPAGSEEDGGSWTALVGCANHSVGDCATERGFQSGDVVSVLADLDSGRIDFAINGVLGGVGADGHDGIVDGAIEGSAGEAIAVEGLFLPRRLVVVPGAGPYRIAARLVSGARVRGNFGQEPFSFAPPAGFTAWGADLDVDGDGACVDAAAIPAPPAPISAVVDCGAGYRLDTFAAAPSDGTQLVVLGMHEAMRDERVDIHIARPGRYALVLGSYEPTQFVVSAAADVVIERVIAHGFREPTVEAPAGVVIETERENVDTLSDTGDTWPYDFGGGDTVGMIDDAQARTGLPLAMFGGAYVVRSFTVHASFDDIVADPACLE